MSPRCGDARQLSRSSTLRYRPAATPRSPRSFPTASAPPNRRARRPTASNLSLGEIFAAHASRPPARTRDRRWCRRPLRARSRSAWRGESAGRSTRRLVAEPRGDEAGMQAIGGDAGSREPARQLAREQDVAEFRAAIGAPAAISSRALQVVEIEPGADMRAPRRSRRFAPARRRRAARAAPASARNRPCG